MGDSQPCNQHQHSLSVASGCFKEDINILKSLFVVPSVLRKLRQDKQSRIIVCFSINLLALNLIVVLGAEQTNNKTLCDVIAMAMHYFLLSSFGWMLVEAYHLYLRVLKVFNSYVRRFLPKSIAFAQGKLSENDKFECQVQNIEMAAE